MKRHLKRAGYALLTLFILANAVSAWQAFIITHFSDERNIRKVHASVFQQKLNRVFGKKPSRQLVVDSLTVPHISIYINSDTFKLAAWHLKHSTDSFVKGTVIMFHGRGSCRSEIIPEATAFYNMQYDVLMIDLRAHGNSNGNVCSMGYFEANDVRAAYNFIETTGERNIILWGGSIGAASITKAMYDDSNIKPSKIILEKCYGTMVDAAKGVVRNSLHEPSQPFATMLTFWASVEEGIWMFKLKPELYVAKINCPVLMQWGEKDRSVLKEETETLYNNLQSEKKKLIIYQTCGHENILGKNPLLWKQNVSAFLDS